MSSRRWIIWCSWFTASVLCATWGFGAWSSVVRKRSPTPPGRLGSAFTVTVSLTPTVQTSFAFSGRLPQRVAEAAAQSLWQSAGWARHQQGGVPPRPVAHGTTWRCHGGGQVRRGWLTPTQELFSARETAKNWETGATLVFFSLKANDPTVQLSAPQCAHTPYRVFSTRP